MSKKSISASQAFLISQLFASKGWSIDDKKELKLSTYNRFLDRYGRIPENTRDLFIELTERFERIDTKEVYKLFSEAYNSIPNETIDRPEKIFILPLVEPQLVFTGNWLERILIAFGVKQLKIDRPKSKSGDRILALVKSANYLELGCSSKFEFPDSFSNIKEGFNEDKDLLILIDDFIGTGDTANKILKQFFTEKNFNKDNTIIVSLVSMQQGIDSVASKQKVKMYFSVLQNRAISDFYKPNSKVKENIQLVKDMGRTVNIKSKNSLGYKKSQALTTIMNKSPNNTIPIFWFETNSIPAPFPRDKKYK